MSNIFLLEAIAYRVALMDTNQKTNTCRLCVCFRFPRLVDLDVCDGKVCETNNSGDEINMTRGKSCLFAIGADNLCAAARDFCDGSVHVYRLVDGSSEPRIVAQAPLEFDRTFEALIQDPNQSDRTRKLIKTLHLFENDRRKPVGTVDVFIRLTSQGKLLVTQFSKSKNQKYQYKALKNFVPTDVKSVKCGHKRHSKKNCCKNRQSREEADDGDDTDCSKKMQQVNCILTAMEHMKKLFVKATLPSLSTSQDQQDNVANDENMQRRVCMFDPHCPVTGCPFRIAEPATTVIDRMTRSNDVCGHVSRAVNDDGDENGYGGLTTTRQDGQIEDDADLFVVKVGRVDPCRRVILEHRDAITQYVTTDIPSEYLPPPPPMVPSPRQSKFAKRKGRKPSKKKKTKGD